MSIAAIKKRRGFNLLCELAGYVVARQPRGRGVAASSRSAAVIDFAVALASSAAARLRPGAREGLEGPLAVGGRSTPPACAGTMRRRARARAVRVQQRPLAGCAVDYY